MKWARKATAILVGLGLLALLLVAPAAAQGTASPVRVEDDSAAVTFGSDVTFTLEATSEVEIVGASLLYGATRSDGRTLVPQDLSPGTDLSLAHVLDTRIFHLPVGVEVGYSWLLRDAAGNEYETPVQSFVYEDLRFDWQQVQVGDVTIYWYDGNQRWGNELGDLTARALERLQKDIGAKLNEPVSIFIYADTDDMRAALQSNSVEWVGGQAVPSLGLIIGAVEAGDTAEAARIIPHELSHQLLHQATDNPYGGVPLWFDEGLAVHNQETPDYIFPVMLEEAALNDQLIPLEALSASFPADPDRALLSYAQSHSVVEYILADYGAERLAALADAFALAMPTNAALEATLGVTVDELDAAWRATLPAAERSRPLEGSPSVAPADRFSEPAVLPQSSAAPRNRGHGGGHGGGVLAQGAIADAAPRMLPASPPNVAGFAYPVRPLALLVGAAISGMVIVSVVTVVVVVRLARYWHQR